MYKILENFKCVFVKNIYIFSNLVLEKGSIYLEMVYYYIFLIF